ncbi:unnamed protein product [Calypogeia fissa]
MSAVSLQRPLFHHWHLPTHLVSPFCRPTRCLSGGGGVVGSGSSASRGGGICSRRSLFGGKVSIDLGATSSSPGRIFFRHGDIRLTWICRGDLGYQKVARRGLKTSPLVKVEEKKADAMEEKPSAKKRPSLVPKKLNLRASGVHGNTFISYVQILGTGMDTGDTSPSVLLFFDKRRIIFNAGEGLQRFCIEHKIKLSKLDHVFLTRVCSETASGLPGLLLTLSNTGETGMTVNLWGSSDLNFLVDAMRTFIPSSSVVHTHSFGQERQESSKDGDSSAVLEGDALMLLEDEVVKISAVLLRPGCENLSVSSPAKRQVAQDTGKDEKDWSPTKRFQGSGRISGPKTDGLSFSFAEPWELGFESETTSALAGSQKRQRIESPVKVESPEVDEQFTSEDNYLPTRGKDSKIPAGGSQGSKEVAVVYICELPEIIGRFDPEKAMAKGLLPGPKYGKLQAGKSVLSDNGKETVHPSDVMDPSSPGPICLVVDCPTTSYVSSLISSSGLTKLSGAGGESMKQVTCIIHLGPASVINCSQYQEWMDQFHGTQHIMAGHGMLGKVSPILKSSARVMSRLNFICPQVFPIVGLQQGEDEIEASQDSPSITKAENLLKFRLRPISSTPIDRSLVPAPLDLSAVQRELIAENPELQEASKTIAELWSPSLSPVAKCVGSLNLSPQEAQSKDPGMLCNSLKQEDEPRSFSSKSEDMLDYHHGLPDCLRGVGREVMEMVFLGTGSSQPSKYRNVSAIYIHLFKRGGMLLDCGEGTYAQLKRRYGNKIADEIVAGLKCVWISHIHADHHTGLARILAVRKKLLENEGKLEPVLVVGPKQLKRYLDAYGRLEDLGMEFLDCSQTTLFAEGAATLAENGQYSGTSSSQGQGRIVNNSAGQDDTTKTMNVQGGLISLPSPGRSSKTDGRPVGGQLRNYWLQTGFHFQAGLDENGREKLKDTLSALGLSQLISVPVVHCPHAFGVVLVARGKKLLQPGWKLVYSGDTRPCQALVEASKDATVLIHEATFDDAMLEEAVAKNHSLTREAVETGVSAGAYRTILTHFSQRYPKIPVFNESYNDRTCIAFDMMSANLADLPLLPKLLPALKLLFKNDMLIVDEGGDEITDQS